MRHPGVHLHGVVQEEGVQVVGNRLQQTIDPLWGVRGLVEVLQILVGLVEIQGLHKYLEVNATEPIKAKPRNKGRSLD